MSRIVRFGSLTLTALWWYLVTAAGLQLFASLFSVIVTGHALPVSAVSLLVLPVEFLTHLPNLTGAWGEAGEPLMWPMTLVILGLVVIGGWVVLARHGIADPRLAGRSPSQWPLHRRMPVKLWKAGVYTDRDPSRDYATARQKDKIMFTLARFIPGVDKRRLLVNRATGMLVPVGDPQPGARIYLGTCEAMGWVRKRRYHVYAGPEHHVAVFGPSGTGKGASQMNPTMLFHNGSVADSSDAFGSGWPGPMVTSTVKNDHIDAALEWRSSLSDQCFVYDPLQLYPEFSDYWVGWSPLADVSSFTDASSVAKALMLSEQQQNVSSSGTDDYFAEQAMMVLSPMILSAALQDLEFTDVYQWSLTLENASETSVDENGNVDPDSDLYAVLSGLHDYVESSGNDVPLNQMQQIFAKDPREASGVWGSIRKALQPYNDEVSVKSTSSAHMPAMLNSRTFYHSPHATLFIVAPEVASEAKRMRPVFAAFISWIIERGQILARENNGKLDLPVVLNLDEVKNVGAIPGLAHTLSLTRSARIFVKHAWQDEAQVESAYGKDDSKTITSNSRTWVVLPGLSDPDHLDKLAKLIGEHSVKKVSFNKSAGKSSAESRTESREQVRAADIAALKELKDDEILVISDNISPFLIKQNRYYSDKVMAARYGLGDARRAGAHPAPSRDRELSVPLAGPPPPRAGHNVVPGSFAAPEPTAASSQPRLPASPQRLTVAMGFSGVVPGLNRRASLASRNVSGSQVVPTQVTCDDLRTLRLVPDRVELLGLPCFSGAAGVYHLSDRCPQVSAPASAPTLLPVVDWADSGCRVCGFVSSAPLASLAADHPVRVALGPVVQALVGAQSRLAALSSQTPGPRLYGAGQLLVAASAQESVDTSSVWASAATAALMAAYVSAARLLTPSASTVLTAVLADVASVSSLRSALSGLTSAQSTDAGLAVLGAQIPAPPSVSGCAAGAASQPAPPSSGWLTVALPGRLAGDDPVLRMAGWVWPVVVCADTGWVVQVLPAAAVSALTASMVVLGRHDEVSEALAAGQRVQVSAGGPVDAAALTALAEAR